MIFEKPKKINKGGVLCDVRVGEAESKTKFSKVKMSEAKPKMG